MVSCPNRKRRRRLHRGGGALECSGRLELVLQVPITLPLVRSLRSARLDWSRAAGAQVRRRGVRIPPAALEAAAMHGYDVTCTVCGWSLRRAMAGLQRRARR